MPRHQRALDNAGRPATVRPGGGPFPRASFQQFPSARHVERGLRTSTARRRRRQTACRLPRRVLPNATAAAPRHPASTAKMPIERRRAALEHALQPALPARAVARPTFMDAVRFDARVNPRGRGGGSHRPRAAAGRGSPSGARAARRIGRVRVEPAGVGGAAVVHLSVDARRAGPRGVGRHRRDRRGRRHVAAGIARRVPVDARLRRVGRRGTGAASTS